MQVSFLMKVPPMQDVEVEYVSIHSGRDADTVVRAATDADRQRFAVEYAAFKAPPVSEVVAPPEAPPADSPPADPPAADAPPAE
jgi:hypothetical protein